MKAFWALALFVLVTCAYPRTPVKTIHVFVALCDNKNQGIVPVPAKLGNGKDPDNNLYWGAMYGVRTFLKKDADWTLLTTVRKPTDNVLERCIFKHRTRDAFLVADAYQGDAIKAATSDFLAAAAGNKPRVQAATLGSRKVVLKLSGKADLAVYVGHNGLMDFKVDAPAPKRPRAAAARQAMVFCCRSDRYFRPLLKQANVEAVATTHGLMAPEGYVLRAALSGWVRGEHAEAIRKRTAKAYAKYQKCSVIAAERLFGAR